MTADEPRTEPPPPYWERIAVMPGEPRIAYRPPHVLARGEDAQKRLSELLGCDPEADDEEEARNARVPSLLAELTGEQRAHPLIAGLADEDGPGEWFRAQGVDDAPAIVDQLVEEGFRADLDVVYFANQCHCCGHCPPHPAIGAALAANPYSANPYSANPYSANPYSANPYSANPYSANPYSANPYSANAESLNVVATGKPPTSSVLPARGQAITPRPSIDRRNIVIGVLDTGLAGGLDDSDGMRPDELGTGTQALNRIRGERDEPSADTDHYLDPVAGHGTFIAGIIEQLTPGCTIEVAKVVEPAGDVAASDLFVALLLLVIEHDPQIVNFSFAGTSTGITLFELLIRFLDRITDIVFVGSAGNEGTCVEQYPAALPEVIGVGALGPDGPAPWTNYGPWVDACAPGTDLVSSFFANFNGGIPPFNGIDVDNFVQWAIWSGTSFAAPVVVAALARDMPTTPGASARSAVERVVRAPHLVRFPYLGTVVNY